MDEPPTDSKPSASAEDTPEELDQKLRRTVLQAAEDCRERFEDRRSRSAHQLGEILDALGRYPHLIEPVYRFMRSEKCPPKLPGAVRAIRKVGDDGKVVFEKKRKGQGWEGPFMVEVTRWAIEECKADPLDVTAFVIQRMPPLLRADCREANRDPEQVGLAIANLLVDDRHWRKMGRPAPRLPDKWRDPEAVLRAILRELGHPRPDNVTRT